MNEQNLCTLYEIASRKNGWLAKLESAFNLTNVEVEFLDWLDSQEIKLNQQLRLFEARIRREGLDEAIIDCDTDEEKMERLNKLIFTLEDQHGEMRAKDAPYLERCLYLFNSRYEHWVNLRRKIRSKLIHLSPSKNGVTDAQIERARNTPFENITEIHKGNNVACLWGDHKRFNSMWVKNGYGWCFKCGTWSDPIKYVMKLKGLNFVESVKSLQ